MDSEKTFFGHPPGLATLFFTEMWERFSYYGMRALLLLFMVASVDEGGMGFDDKTGGAIYGLYTMFVYLLALPGGWLRGMARYLTSSIVAAHAAPTGLPAGDGPVRRGGRVTGLVAKSPAVAVSAASAWPSGLPSRSPAMPIAAPFPPERPCCRSTIATTERRHG